MPYIIAAVVLIVAGVAFTLYQSNSAEEAPIVEVREAEPLPANSEEASELAETTPDSDSAATLTPSDTPTNQNDPAVSQLNDELIANESSASDFADGTYTTVASYFTPRRTEHIMDITITLTDGVITDADIQYDGEAPKTPSHNNFDNAYKTAVVGQPIEEVFLSRVGGASLTSDSFNEAIEEVKAEARS